MPEENEVVETVEVAADSIEALAGNIAALKKAVDRMMNSGLTRKTLVLLLQDQTKLPKSSINYVLNALQRIDEYLVKEKRK